MGTSNNRLRNTEMIRYHEFNCLTDALAALNALRASGHRAYLLCMRSDFYEVREVCNEEG